MSIDLEWSKLDSSLADYLVGVLNKQLKSTTRPSFIGPIEVVSLSFGTVPPEVELLDLREIYRDFLEADDDENENVKVTEGAAEEEGYEWVPRKASGRNEDTHQHLPPHIRYGRSDMFASSPSLNSPRDIWGGGSMGMSFPDFVDLRSSWHGAMYRSPTPATPFGGLHHHLTRSNSVGGRSHSLSANPYPNQTPDVQTESSTQDSLEEAVPLPNNQPNLQLHLRINWPSDLRITLTTSLLINYPSPMFMSLPIKLSVTGLLFNGELTVAYEGERSRVHLCILDDLDPFGPAGDRSKRGSFVGTPPEIDEDSPVLGIPPRPVKPSPVGQRLLPSIDIESEIGQADKHVLKNVTRVERFIQDVIRKTIEEELVFPNFHTLIMGEK